MQRSDDRRGRTYGRWQVRDAAEIRLLLTARHGEPVVDLRYGEYGAAGSWIPSARGIFFKLDELPALQRAVAALMKDVRAMRLLDRRGRHDR